jgi:hypothetical protein
MRAALLSLLALPALAFASPGRADERGQSCRFEGWIESADPAALEVRAAPSPGAALVGRLPPPERDEDYAFGTEFRVVEARGGWFRIEDAYRWSQGRDMPSTLPEGWIPGSALDFALQTDKAFEAPDPRSRVVATSWQAADGAHTFTYRLPSDCRGEWVRLLVTGRDGREQQAWVRGVCGMQATTCDGMQGDPIPPDDLPRAE